MNKPTNMRFAHIQHSYKNYNGMTVAYSRTDTNVFFSYAMCVKADQYSKSVGRNITTKTFMDNIDDIHHDVTYVDPIKRVGCVSIEDVRGVLRDNADVTYLFADHVIDELTFMGLKHAAVAGFVLKLISSDV